jgi:hypothetical protein
MQKTIFLLLLLGCCSIALAQPGNWKTFRHPNGFSLQLPPAFKEGLLVAGNTLQWYACDTCKEVEVSVEAFGSGEAGQLSKALEERRQTFRTVTYQVLRSTWFVVSGLTTEGISYVKAIVKNGRLYTLYITYPAERQQLLNGWLPRIAASFR